MADPATPQPALESQRFGDALTVGGVIIPIDIDLSQAEEKIRQFQNRIADDPIEVSVTATGGGGEDSEDIRSILEGIAAQVEELKASVTAMSDAIRSLAENGINVVND